MRSRKRGIGMCRICNQAGHYQKTCPLVTAAVDASNTSRGPVGKGIPAMESLFSSQLPDSSDGSSSEDEDMIPLATTAPDKTLLKADHPDNRKQMPWQQVSLTPGNSLQMNVNLMSKVQGSSSTVGSNFHAREEANTHALATSSRRWGSWKKDARRFIGPHFPQKVADSKEDGKIKDRRHRCKWGPCKRKTKFRCVGCDVFLCIGCEDSNNCFLMFHTSLGNTNTNTNTNKQ